MIQGFKFKVSSHVMKHDMKFMKLGIAWATGLPDLKLSSNYDSNQADDIESYLSLIWSLGSGV